MILDRLNAEIAYADLADASLSEELRERARRQAAQLGARWLEFYCAGVLLGRAERIVPRLPQAQGGTQTRTAHGAEQMQADAAQTSFAIMDVANVEPDATFSVAQQ